MNKKTILLWMFSLIGLSGFLNVLVITLFSTTVSHVTGLLSYFSIAIVSRDSLKLNIVIVSILSYLIGSILSGFIIGTREFSFKKRYGYITFSIGVLILAAFEVLRTSDVKMVFILAFLMGLQNGMILNFKGVIVRLTHMTGNLTDLGVHIGYILKGKSRENLAQVMVPLVSIIVFVLGATLGGYLFLIIGVRAFTIAAIIYIASGLFYLIYQFNHTKCHSSSDALN